MARNHKIAPEQRPSNYERAQKLADDLLTRPLTDSEALSLAGVYASLAHIDAITSRAAEDIIDAEEILENGENA